VATSRQLPNGDRQFQWYPPETDQVFQAFLDSA